MKQPPKETRTMDALMRRFARSGVVVWIGLRPERRVPVVEADHVQAIAGRGLEGDRDAAKAGGDRQVTLIMAEHLRAAASLLGKAEVDPGLVRRNIVTEGVNLVALKGKKFRIGGALLEMTKDCPPCSRMEENLGEGGYNAMRGHGGWCARIIESGKISRGDIIEVLEAEE